MTQAYREALAAVPRRLQNRKTYAHLLIDVGIWALMLAPLGRFHPAAAALLLPVFSFRAFGLMHECVHSSGHSNRRLNHVLGLVYGLFCFLPFESWKNVHLNHHLWTGNVEMDPTTKILVRFRDDGRRVPRHMSVCWKYWIPLLGLMQHVVFWRAAVASRQFVLLSASVVYLGLCGYWLGAWSVMAGLLIYLYMVEIINFPHHLTMVQYDGEARFAASEQQRFTRSCVYAKWFARYVLLNFNLHTEHHLFPAHPWYQLDAIHQEISARGLLLNSARANAWIWVQRRRPLVEVLSETFDSASHSKAA